MNKIKTILKEDILRNGTMTLYHGSKDLILWGSIEKGRTKFEPLHGVGGVYGPGLYTVLEKDMNSGTFRGVYGKYIIKIFSKLTNKFFIADYDIYKKIYGENPNFIKDQCDKFNIDYSHRNFTEDPNQDGISLVSRYYNRLDGVIYTDTFSTTKEKICILYNANNFKVAGYYEVKPGQLGSELGALNKEIDKVRLCNYKTVHDFLSKIENHVDNVPTNFVKIIQKLSKFGKDYYSFKERCYKQFIDKYFKDRTDFYKILISLLTSKKITDDDMRKNPYIIDMKLLPEIKEDSDDLFFSHTMEELSYIYFGYKYYQFCRELADAGILKTEQFGAYIMEFNSDKILPDVFNKLIEKSLLTIDVSWFGKLDKETRMKVIKNNCSTDISRALNKLISKIENADEELLELIIDISYNPSSISLMTFESFKTLFSFICKNTEIESMITVLVNFFSLNNDLKRSKLCRLYVIKTLQELEEISKDEYQNCVKIVQVLNANTNINIPLNNPTPHIQNDFQEPITGTKVLAENKVISDFDILQDCINVEKSLSKFIK